MKKFITFEGGEGTGKSTQAKLLLASIKNTSERVILTREPGGTEIAEEIRKIIVKDNYNLNTVSELLLIYAARNEHLKDIITPSLDKGDVILCDRFLDSTFVYQVQGKKIDQNIFEYFNNLIVRDYKPEITFIIDIDPRIGIERSLKLKKKETKYEKLPLSFHEKVRNNFITLSKKGHRFKLIDGNKSIMEIHKEIIMIINEKKMMESLKPIQI